MTDTIVASSELIRTTESRMGWVFITLTGPAWLAWNTYIELMMEFPPEQFKTKVAERGAVDTGFRLVVKHTDVPVV